MGMRRDDSRRDERDDERTEKTVQVYRPRTATAAPQADAPRTGDMPVVYVSNNQTRDPRVRTHWFFDNMIERIEGSARDGEAVTLHDKRGKFLGSAIYNSHSKIRCRLFSLDRTRWDVAYVRGAVAAALKRRSAFLRAGESMRLIYADADFLPGFVADRLGDVVVIQVLTFAADRMVDAVVAELDALIKPAGYVIQLGSHLRGKEGLPMLPNRTIGEVPSRVWVPQDGFGLYADVVGGQKTGLFLDQRFNRRLIAPWAGGRRVLDLFSHVGGWAMAALAQGAAHATCVDSSADALKLAQEGATRNGYGEEMIEFVKNDCFDFLDHASENDLSWDLIVTDPPAFAKNAHIVESALRGYYSLNYRAMKQLAPGGILVACSCSQVVSEDVFEECLETAARNAHRNLHVVARGGQGPDHPVLLGFPESRYLKCVILKCAD